MNLTAEQYKEIETMASLFFSAEQIAINIEVDPDEFTELIETHQGDAYKAYFSGRITTETQLRQSILQSAINGSSPAQQLMIEFQKRSNYE